MRFFVEDLRLAARALSRSRGFALLAIVTLALGIGATTTVFSILHGVLLRPPPYANPEQLVFITLEKAQGGAAGADAAGAQFAEWETQSQSFAELAAYDWTFNFLIHPDGNESLEGMVGSASLFRALGVNPILGRTFTDEERSARQHPVIILGHGLWQRRFQSDPDIVGKTVRLSRLPPLTVIGVMPPGVRFLPSRANAQEPNYNLHALVDYWLPAAPDPNDRRERSLNVIGRLRPEKTVPQAQAEMTLLAARQAQADPALAGITAKVTSVNEVLNGEIRRVLVPLFGAVCFVLLIATANVAGLLLVRGLSRQREVAVRAALGAGRARLLWVGLAESLLLAGAGGGLGALLATAATRWLLAVAPNSIPRLDQVGTDYRVLGFALGATLLTGLITGLLPAWQVLKTGLHQALKEAGRPGSGGPGHRRALKILLVSELALTLVLLISAGLMLQTISRLGRVKPGYDTSHILTMVVTTLGTNWLGFHEQALERVSALPGVVAAAFVWGLPLTGNHWTGNLRIEGRPETETETLKNSIPVPLRSISPDYFKLMGITLKEGRAFSDREGTNPVAIINETFARRHFRNENPLGQRIAWSRSGGREIVGVVSDLQTVALGRSAEPEVYLPFFQAGAFSKHLTVRAQGDPRALIDRTRRELRAVDPGVVVEEIKTMEQIRAEASATQRFALTLIGVFSLAALSLSVVGIYGVMSHSVLQRTREIGVRMALGAQPQDVLQLVLRDALGPTLTGLALGVAGALAVTRLLQHLLFGVTATDLLTFSVLPAVLASVALLACWTPAQRATRIDPMKALREE
jgi:putative ABC transport system permease protein